MVCDDGKCASSSKTKNIVASLSLSVIAEERKTNLQLHSVLCVRIDEYWAVNEIQHNATNMVSVIYGEICLFSFNYFYSVLCNILFINPIFFSLFVLELRHHYRWYPGDFGLPRTGSGPEMGPWSSSCGGLPPRGGYNLLYPKPGRRSGVESPIRLEIYAK